MLWNTKIDTVITAGRTMGATIFQHIRSSPAPSMRPLSMISSGTMSMNCRMRNIPRGMHSMGASRAMKLSIQFMEDSTIYLSLIHI